MKHFSYKPSDAVKEFFACFSNNDNDLKIFIAPFINRYKSFVYIVDKNLPKEYMDKVVAITRIKTEDNVVFVDPSMKKIDRVTPIWDLMVKYVPNAAIVIGGGTVGDISGFACGTYQRGIPRIYFPTTVLSMVDGSIGGRNGIDHIGIKNSIGVIHYPEAIVNYTPFLKTLDKAEYYSGFAEIIKAAVLYDESFFVQLEQFSQSLSKYQYDSQETLDMLYKSSLIEANICEEPNNKRRRLLYGHTIGHAYEMLTQRHKRHGDSVAIGMYIESAISVLLGFLNKKEWIRLERLLVNLGLPKDLPSNTNLDEFLAKMLKYRRLVDDENYLFSLPDRIGHVNNQEGSCLTPIRKSKMKAILIDTLSWIKKNSHVQHYIRSID
ncbi:MAG: 3-dehydroquinate synthase family protein [Patescibacteria group bacterium]